MFFSVFSGLQGFFSPLQGPSNHKLWGGLRKSLAGLFQVTLNLSRLPRCLAIKISQLDVLERVMAKFSRKDFCRNPRGNFPG